jgi:arylsulfatase A-like enzyme
VNVLWIVADTVRTDALGCHGGAVHTPNLDALAASSVDFTRAVAASFPTVPARADYLTGRYAFAAQGWGPLPPAVETVPERLGAAGITTVGVVDTPFFTMRGFNYDRGFQYFYDLPVQLHEGMDEGRGKHDPRFPRGSSLVPRMRAVEADWCAPTTFALAEQCLEQLYGEQFLLYVDTWDPHEPFDPPRWYVDRYRPGWDGRTVYPCYGPPASYGLSDDDVELARACWAGKLTMVDRWIGRLLDRLDSMGLLDTTAVIFTSDHGFEFGDHGSFGKMRAAAPGEMRWARSPLYRELADVPLMVRVPGVAPRADARVVSAIDIAPTVLDLFGVPVPGDWHGDSLLPLVQDAARPDDRAAVTAAPLAMPGAGIAVVDDVIRNVTEWQPLTVTTSRWSLLFSRWDDRVELYDLAADPHQTRDVAADHPVVVRELHGRLLATLERAEAPADQRAART